MRSQRVVVLGGGVAGLSAALILDRDGHQVTLVERDPVEQTPPNEAFGWARSGIPHFFHPHAFMPRGRREMMKHLPDVYQTLIGAGAGELDFRTKLPGDPKEGDEELQMLLARRPFIEWGLRRALLDGSGIKVLSEVTARGITMEQGGVAQVALDTGTLGADVIVDAMGRRSPMRSWLADQGWKPPSQEHSECGVIYYSRYYRLLPGRELPDGPWLLSPRGDVGYMGFASFGGDNGAFATVISVPTGVPDLKIFKDERAYAAAVKTLTPLNTWVDPDIAEPITSVLPMGGLQNTADRSDGSWPAGLFPVGDAYGHTDPVLALGLSFSLTQAGDVVQALRDHDDMNDASGAFVAATRPEFHERYAFASALDEQRHRHWTGKGADFMHRTGDYALFSTVAMGAVAMVDPAVTRGFLRRIGMLESLRVLDEDIELQERIEKTFAQMFAVPRPPQGPPLDEMLSICRSAIESSRFGVDP